MRNYYVTYNKLVAHFEDAETARRADFTEPIDIGTLADVVTQHFTLEFWEGSPSEGWSVYRINEELADLFGNPESYVHACLEEAGYSVTPTCLNDVVFEVNRRLQEDDRYEVAPAFKYKKVD